tara:strand:+ start:43 stop:579 length:537 start_codon:yes stop_codon:yes gene_type:complete
MGSTLTVDNIVGATTAANVKLPAGSILQTQTFQGQNGDGTHTNFSVSSTSYGATAAAVSITPKYSSSKILVTFHAQGFYQNGTVANAIKLALYKSAAGGSFAAVSGLNAGQVSRHIGYMNHANSTTLHQASFQHLDSPATTNALIYKIYLARLADSGYGRIMANEDDSFSITAMEISQ